MAKSMAERGTGRAAAYRNCSSTNHFLSFSEHLAARAASEPAGCGRVHWPAPPQWPFCAAENFRPRREVQLPGADRLIDVAADGVDLARPRIDMGHHLAMGAPDGARVGAAAELRPDALAHRRVADVGERRLALLADQVADAGLGGERTGAIEPLAGLLAGSAALAANAS